MVGKGSQADLRALLSRIRELAFAEFSSQSVRLAYCEGAMDAMKPILAKGEKELVQELLEEQHKLVRAYPDEEELRTHYSSSLGLLVFSEGVLEVREQQFKRLKAFCEEFPNDWTLDIALAQAARLLCEKYVLADRLPDAESMNQIIRGLAHPRSLRRVIPIITRMKLELHMELELAETDFRLIEPFMRAQRYREVNDLLEELNRLWRRTHPEDTRFAKCWALAVMTHADARAREGHFEQIGKTLQALRDFSGKFPGNAEFADYGSMLALNALKRAADAGEFSIAEEMFDTLQKFAQGLSGEQGPVANYAEGSLALCIAYQNRGQMEESKSVPRAAAWALRSEGYRQRCLEGGGEESMEVLLKLARCHWGHK